MNLEETNVKEKNSILRNTLNSSGLYTVAFLFFAVCAIMTPTSHIDIASNLRYVFLGLCGSSAVINLFWNFNERDLYRKINFWLGILVAVMFAIALYVNPWL